MSKTPSINVPGIDLSKVTPEMLYKLFGPQTAPAPAPTVPQTAPAPAPARKVKTPAPAPQTAPTVPQGVTPEMLSSFFQMMSGKTPTPTAPETAPLEVPITPKDLTRTVGTLNKGFRAHGIPEIAWGSPERPGEPEGYVHLVLASDHTVPLMPETAPWTNVTYGLGILLQLLESPWGQMLLSRLTPAPAPASKVTPAPQTAPAPQITPEMLYKLFGPQTAPAPAPAPAPVRSPFAFPKL